LGEKNVFFSFQLRGRGARGKKQGKNEREKISKFKGKFPENRHCWTDGREKSKLRGTAVAREKRKNAGQQKEEKAGWGLNFRRGRLKINRPVQARKRFTAQND